MWKGCALKGFFYTLCADNKLDIRQACIFEFGLIILEQANSIIFFPIRVMEYLFLSTVYLRFGPISTVYMTILALQLESTCMLNIYTYNSRSGKLYVHQESPADSQLICFLTYWKSLSDSIIINTKYIQPVPSITPKGSGHFCFTSCINGKLEVHACQFYVSIAYVSLIASTGFLWDRLVLFLSRFSSSYT